MKQHWNVRRLLNVMQCNLGAVYVQLKIKVDLDSDIYVTLYLT